jgi:hypothetical protein
MRSQIIRAEARIGFKCGLVNSISSRSLTSGHFEELDGRLVAPIFCLHCLVETGWVRAPQPATTSRHPWPSVHRWPRYRLSFSGPRIGLGPCATESSPGAMRTMCRTVLFAGLVQAVGILYPLHAFTKRLRKGLRRARVTCSVRISTRPRVRIGARYRLDDGEIEIDSTEPSGCRIARRDGVSPFKREKRGQG